MQHTGLRLCQQLVQETSRLECDMAVDDVEDGTIGFCSCGSATSNQAGCIVFPGSSGHGLLAQVAMACSSMWRGLDPAARWSLSSRSQGRVFLAGMTSGSEQVAVPAGLAAVLGLLDTAAGTPPPPSSASTANAAAAQQDPRSHVSIGLGRSATAGPGSATGAALRQQPHAKNVLPWLAQQQVAQDGSAKGGPASPAPAGPAASQRRQSLWEPPLSPSPAGTEAVPHFGKPEVLPPRSSAAAGWTNTPGSATATPRPAARQKRSRWEDGGDPAPLTASPPPQQTPLQQCGGPSAAIASAGKRKRNRWSPPPSAGTSDMASTPGSNDGSAGPAAGVFSSPLEQWAAGGRSVSPGGLLLTLACLWCYPSR